MPALLVVGHLLVLAVVVVVVVLLVDDGVAAVAAAAHAAAARGGNAAVLDPLRAPLLGLVGTGVAALALAQVLAIRTLTTGWTPRSPAVRVVLRPVTLTLGALTVALPVAVLAVLALQPPAVYGPPHPGRLLVLAALAAACLLLCGVPAGVQPHWWRRAR